LLLTKLQANFVRLLYIDFEMAVAAERQFRVWTKSSPFRTDILDDRVACVTGGGSGIGFEVARQLGLHGAKLCLMGRREDFLRDACNLLKAENIVATYSAGDVRKPEDCAAVDAFGFVNILVNGAAGMFPASAGESLTPNGFKTVVDIDLLGTYNMCYAAYSELKKTGQAVICNITVPRHYLEGRNWWVSSMQSAKAAITTLSHTLAKEWAEFGIRVVNVGPGAIADTPALLKAGGAYGITAKAKELKSGVPVNQEVPLGRFGTSFEIGMATVFLCVSEYITAETIVVDGGWWLGASRPFPSREQLEAVTRKNESKSRALKPSNL